MPFFIISVIIQVTFVVHVVKTGRNTTWIWIIVMLPLAGSIAYLLLEVLPEISGSKTGRKAAKKFESTVNPNKSLNKAASDFSVSDTVENSLALADELMNKGMFEDAKVLYQRCMRGLHETDPVVMSKLAYAEFSLGNFSESKQTLDALIEANPDFKSADSHLLYARTLEELKDYDGALSEYEVLSEYYTGPEATYRYAMLCKRIGDTQKSHQLMQDIMRKSQTAGKHYNALHRDWIKKVKSEIGA